MEIVEGNNVYNKITDRHDILYILLGGTTRVSTIPVLSSARAVNDSFIASGEFFIELLVISPMPMEESTVWAM